MPAWQPNWQDVRWNTIWAISFVNTLNQAAAAVEALVDVRRRAGATYFADWQGPRYATIAGALEIAYGRLLELAAGYRDMAARIQSQDVAATAEQRRREQERRRWEDERAEEQRRAHQYLQ